VHLHHPLLPASDDWPFVVDDRAKLPPVSTNRLERAIEFLGQKIFVDSLLKRTPHAPRIACSAPEWAARL
jgi:hypothetical protein